MDVQEPLRVGGRREAAHSALPLARGLVRDLGTIVRVLGRVMGDQGHDLPMCDTVAAQLVSHETRRFLSLTLQESSKESPRRAPVPARLDEEVDQVPVLVHGAPEILALTVDRDEDFVPPRSMVWGMPPDTPIPPRRQEPPEEPKPEPEPDPKREEPPSRSAAAATVHSATESAEPLTVDLGWRKRAPPSPMRAVTL